MGFYCISILVFFYDLRLSLNDKIAAITATHDGRSLELFEGIRLAILDNYSREILKPNHRVWSAFDVNTVNKANVL